MELEEKGGKRKEEREGETSQVSGAVVLNIFEFLCSAYINNSAHPPHLLFSPDEVKLRHFLEPESKCLIRWLP